MASSITVHSFSQKLTPFLEDKLTSNAIARQFLYSEQEEQNNLPGKLDPIGDARHAKGGQIIHRYKNRALWTVTQACPVHCRYCFRRNELSTPNDIFKIDREQTLNYLKAHPEIEEVILTGGDPLILSNDKLTQVFALLSEVANVQIVRIHTRTPVVDPARLSLEFNQLLQKYSTRFKILLILHINHPDEWSEELKHARGQLPHMIEVLSQSVLLKSVNDDPATLATLFRTLSINQIRPYYLHHPDQVEGGMHFYVNIEDGRRIYHQVKNELSGWMLPQYVIDVAEGEGKTSAYNPEQFHYSGTFINREANLVIHAEPQKRL